MFYLDQGIEEKLKKKKKVPEIKNKVALPEVKELGMHVSVSRKKYKKVKEVGITNMSVATIAFYQLMQVRQPYFPGKPMQPLADQFGYYMQKAPTASVFNGGIVPPGIKSFMPFHAVDIRPSNACPRNFIIFDQTSNQNQIMFHPEINSKFFYPGFCADTIFGDNIDRKDSNDEVKIASPFKEDSDDIDALLSTEDDETKECEDDEVSTARTRAVHECHSLDSCSNYESTAGKSRSHFRKSSGSHRNDKKPQRMRKMVKVLRGIVPGANRMSTVAVLDEAVRYLKFLKFEVRKLGVRKSKG